MIFYFSTAKMRMAQTTPLKPGMMSYSPSKSSVGNLDSQLLPPPTTDRVQPKKNTMFILHSTAGTNDDIGEIESISFDPPEGLQSSLHSNIIKKYFLFAILLASYILCVK
jgi:hypothetical protein